MKTIVKGRENTIKLLGELQPEHTNYRLMNYTLCSECDDGTLLYNVITGQLVLLNDEESALIKRLPSALQDAMIELINHRFIVPVDYDEKNTVLKLRLLLQQLFPSKGINGYTILPTTNCNARCFYCYENNFSHINMSKEVANQLVEYMISHKGKGPLRLSWFGGEPLLGRDRIEQICRSLRNHGIEYVSSMVTNGYLFTKEIAEQAVRDWNVKTVQITIDGTEQVYNYTKSYVTAVDSPYQRVMRNIHMLLEMGFNVSIRLNLDKHNENDLINLMNELADRFAGFENIDVYVHTLFENEGYSPIPRDEESRKSLYKRQVEFNCYLEENGLKKRHLYLPSLRVTCCTADAQNTACVYPDGHLFKCEHTGLLPMGILIQMNLMRLTKKSFKHGQSLNNVGNAHCIRVVFCLRNVTV